MKDSAHQTVVGQRLGRTGIGRFGDGGSTREELTLLPGEPPSVAMPTPGFLSHAIRKGFVFSLIMSIASASIGGANEELDPGSPRELQNIEARASSAVTQAEMNASSDELMEYWEQRLKETEEKVRQSLSNESQRKVFETTQKAWRDFRTAEMSLHGSSYEGGSMRWLVENATAADLTRKRVAELESFLRILP